MFCSYLKDFLKPTWRLPSSFVPSSRPQYLKSLEKCSLYLVSKYLKRRIFFELCVRQFGLVKECRHIEQTHKRILWINFAAPSVGDSLMDLAARTMLGDREIVLLTNAKNASLYEDDEYFAAVYTSCKALKELCTIKRFDLVICDAFSPRVLLQKICVAPKTNFLGFYGFLNGFDVHRTYFAFARMKELLSLEHLNHPVRPYISQPDCKKDLPQIDVCVAVGGEWPFRTYNHWSAVIRYLIDKGLSVSLIGSTNGLRQADLIINGNPSVRSTVGKLSLAEVVSEIANSRLFIGADGGLWNIATAIPRPTIALFADCQLFDATGARVTRETSDMVCEILYNDDEVSNIAVDDILFAFESLWRQLENSAN